MFENKNDIYCDLLQKYVQIFSMKRNKYQFSATV